LNGSETSRTQIGDKFQCLSEISALKTKGPGVKQVLSKIEVTKRIDIVTRDKLPKTA